MQVVPTSITPSPSTIWCLQPSRPARWRWKCTRPCRMCTPLTARCPLSLSMSLRWPPHPWVQTMATTNPTHPIPQQPCESRTDCSTKLTSGDSNYSRIWTVSDSFEFLPFSSVTQRNLEWLFNIFQASKHLTSHPKQTAAAWEDMSLSGGSGLCPIPPVLGLTVTEGEALVSSFSLKE